MTTNDFYRIYDDVLDMFNNDYVLGMNNYSDDTIERASWLLDDMQSQFTEDEPNDQPCHGKITSFAQVMRKLIRQNLINMEVYNDCVYATNDFADGVCDFLQTNLQNYMSMRRFLREYSYSLPAGVFPGKSLFIASTDVRALLNDMSISLEDANMFRKIGESKCCNLLDSDFLDKKNPEYNANVKMLKLAFTAPDIGFALAICAFCNSPRKALREMNELPDGLLIKNVFRAYLNDFKILKLLQASSSVRDFLYEPPKDRLGAFLDLLS